MKTGLFGKRGLCASVLVLLALAVTVGGGTALGAGSDGATGTDQQSSSDGPLRTIIAFFDGNGNEVYSDTELAPGTNLRVLVSVQGVPSEDTQATAYVKRVKIIDGQEILDGKTFGKDQLIVYSNGHSTPKFVSLPVPDRSDLDQPYVAAVVAYDADGPGVGADSVDIIASAEIRVLAASLDSASVRRKVAERYQPILYLHQEEKYWPVGVEEGMINHSIFLCDASEGTDHTEGETYVANALHGLRLKEFPEIVLGIEACDNERARFDIREGNGHAQWWNQAVAGYAQANDAPVLMHAESVDEWYEREVQRRSDAIVRKVVYFRVASVGKWTTVQYWFFYVYDEAPSYPNHEGDWEGIQLWFGPDVSLAEIESGVDPDQVGYAVHAHGTSLNWEELGKSVWRPHVYVAVGTHASYHKEGNWRLRLPRIPDSCDLETDRATPDSILRTYELRDLVEQPWLEWRGRWGGLGLKDGPIGPASDPGKPQWSTKPEDLVDEGMWYEEQVLCGQ